MSLQYANYEPVTLSPQSARHNRHPQPAQVAVSTMSQGWGRSATVADEFADLLRAAQNGDDLAFDSIVRQYKRVAEAAARRILATDEAVADAVQEAIYKIYRALPRFQDGNFCSWITRIVTNTCYDHLRRQKRRQAYSLDALTDYDKGKLLHGVRAVEEVDEPEKVALQREKMQVLLDAINDLPRSQRTVVLLVDIHGLDYEEAAYHLDVPMGTVKSRLSRARATLRESLTAIGMVPGAAN